LHHVYVGNIHDVDASSTYCPGCGVRVIERDWHRLGEWSLTDQGACVACGTQLPGRFAGPPGQWGRRRVPVRMSRSGPTPVRLAARKLEAAGADRVEGS
jgi:pyruvate formate lyase activating enzyme